MSSESQPVKGTMKHNLIIKGIEKSWNDEECKIFGKLCRSHNIAIIQNQYDSMDILYNKPCAFLGR